MSPADELVEARGGVLLPRRSFLGWTAALVAVAASPIFLRRPLIIPIIMTWRVMGVERDGTWTVDMLSEELLDAARHMERQLKELAA